MPRMRGYDSGNRSGNRRWVSLRSTHPTGCLTFESESPSPRPAVAGVLRQVAVLALFADVVLLVIAMAPGGVERHAGSAAGALVALVVLGDRRDGFGHSWSPLFTEEINARRGGIVPGGTR